MTILIISFGSCVERTIGTASIFAKCLNKTHLPSITGSAPSGPIFPRPKTADPSDITAIKLFFNVYSFVRFLCNAKCDDTAATPGV